MSAVAIFFQKQSRKKMNPDPEFTREFTERFIGIYKVSPRSARIRLVSAFMNCYGLCTPDERRNLLTMTLMMAAKIGEEKFEDGLDFISFLEDTKFSPEENPWNSKIISPNVSNPFPTVQPSLLKSP